MATWTATNPTSVGDPTKKDHYNKLWDNVKELHDVITAITNGTLGTTEPADFRVDKNGIATDVGGTGLAGGDGTALSVDGIVEAGTTELKVKVIDIGDWNMDSTILVSKAHGLTLGNIRQVYVLIRNDDNDSYFSLERHDDGFFMVDGTNVNMTRAAGELFDGADYDATSYNRGWITIWYEA